MAGEFARPIDITESGRVAYGLDDGLQVEFYTKPVKMEDASEREGRPIYEDRIFTRIYSPGNTKTTWDYQSKGVAYTYSDDGELTGYRIGEERVNDYGHTTFIPGGDLDPLRCDPIRFPKAWARFEQKGEKVKEGWAIEEWGVITRSQAENLKAHNVRTVEAMAALTDAAVDNIMGGRKYRDLAKAALDEANLMNLASVEQERANKAEARVKSLEETVAAMKAQIVALSEKKRA